MASPPAIDGITSLPLSALPPKVEALTSSTEASTSAGDSDLDGLSPLPTEKLPPSSGLDTLKRIPTGYGNEGEGLKRVRTVELNGKQWPTRTGGGEMIGEPLRDARTHEEITYIDWPEGDPDVSLSFELLFSREGGGAVSMQSFECRP